MVRQECDLLVVRAMRFIKKCRTLRRKHVPKSLYNHDKILEKQRKSAELLHSKSSERENQADLKKNAPPVVATVEIKKQKQINDIDGIFSMISKPIQDTTQPTAKLKGRSIAAPIQESTSSYGLMKSANVSIISPEAPLERIDKETGYPVYKAHLLKIGEGGGTELCPFDCDCCF